MYWFDEQKKFVFLLEQEEELHYSLNQLEKHEHSVGIVYTGDWDIEIRSWHEKRLPTLEKIYPHIKIIDNQSLVNRKNLSGIKEILKKGPVPLSIRELFSCSYENMMQYHQRRWNKHETYTNLLDKICSLHDWLLTIPKYLYPNIIVMPEKIGWMRKYIAYFFYSKDIPLYAFMGLRFDQKYALEICHRGKLTYFGHNGIELFKQAASDKYLSSINVEEYRNKENKQLNRNQEFPFLVAFKRHVYSLLVATKVYVNNLLLLLLRGKITTKYNDSWNKYSVVTGFYIAVWVGFWWFIWDTIAWKISKNKDINLDEEFLLLPLHHYPETSTVGEYSYVQTEIQYFEQILNVFDSVEKIIIVEHPTTMFSGERSRWVSSFYKLTRGITFFPLITPFGIPFDILNKSKCVITIIGAVAIENALCGGKSFISVLHPMLYVKDIKLLDIPINSKLEEYLDLGKINITAKEYCALTKEFGLPPDKLLFFID